MLILQLAAAVPRDHPEADIPSLTAWGIISGIPRPVARQRLG
jgi:hypothetical protein